MKLKRYISKNPELSQLHWAEKFGVSRSYFTQIVGGTRFPSRNVIIAIDHATRGEVPPASWFEGYDYESLKKRAA